MLRIFEQLLKEAKDLAANTRIIQTDADRAIMNQHIRLLEALLNGEPTTEAQKRHHE